MTRKTLIKIRRDTSVNWNGVVLAEGEPGYDIDTKQLKFGDGATVFQSLGGINADLLDSYHGLSYSMDGHGHTGYADSKVSTETLTTSGAGWYRIAEASNMDYIAPLHIIVYNRAADWLLNQVTEFIVYCQNMRYTSTTPQIIQLGQYKGGEGGYVGLTQVRIVSPDTSAGSIHFEVYIGENEYINSEIIAKNSSDWVQITPTFQASVEANHTATTVAVKTDGMAVSGKIYSAGTEVSLVGHSHSGSIVTSEITETTQSASVNYAYICNNASRITITLPSTAAVGDMLKIIGKGAGGWKIAQNAGQYIQFTNVTSTVGVTGYLQSNNRYDVVTMVCTIANTMFTVTDSMGIQEMG